jgi:hypothetical protein
VSARSAPVDRVDRMLAFLEQQRVEIDALPSGAVRFVFHQGELRVVVERTQKLTASPPNVRAEPAPQARALVR